MGYGFADALGEWCGAAFDLGCFQQVPAGFMEDHATKSVGEHHRHLATVHIVSTQHGGRTGAHLLSGGFNVPVAQIIGFVGGSVPTSDAGAVVTVCSQHTEAAGLMQPDVASKGAVTGSHEHFLPVPGEIAAPYFKMLAKALQALGSFKQSLGDDIKVGCALQPIVFRRSEISESAETLK